MSAGFCITGIPDKTMPASYLDTLAAQQSISYNHLLATLEGRMNWRGMDIVLTGIAPEVCPPGQKKQADDVRGRSGHGLRGASDRRESRSERGRHDFARRQEI